MASAVLSVCPPWGAPALPRRTAREQKAPAGGLRGPGTEQQRRGRKRWPPQSPGRGPTGARPPASGRPPRPHSLSHLPTHTRRGQRHSPRDTEHQRVVSASHHWAGTGPRRHPSPSWLRHRRAPSHVGFSAADAGPGVSRARHAGTTATARAPGHAWPCGGAAVGALMRTALCEGGTVPTWAPGARAEGPTRGARPS